MKEIQERNVDAYIYLMKLDAEKWILLHDGGHRHSMMTTNISEALNSVLKKARDQIGYSLPWDQIGYWAMKIVTGVPEAIPVIGSPLVELLWGSASVGQSTLTDFYSLHTFVLSLLTVVFMLMHFSMIRKQGISGPL
ncbi:hypothetical protein M9H77_16485 [Catharanthus roseus]|uniref:Uncharacterized protein n=1 Tax=Catharanthus roseus TaxID=4058 RepID=A0ACC0B1W4_CATRO|nr:hypothetical protein M9H77_16485 [Catharanthus roseus]